MVRHRLVSMRYVLLALPSLAVTLGLAVFAGAELSGAHPLTWGEPRSVSEAIALRDGAAAARLLEDGAGIDDIGLIRAGILAPQPVLATPLETAILVDAAAMFEYLASRGAQVKPFDFAQGRPFDSAQGRPDLSCLARDIGARAVRTHIAEAPSCSPGAALQAVFERP